MGIDKNFNPDIFHPNYFMRRRLLESIRLISHHVKGRVMDLGCGSKPYQSIFHCQEYIGVDFDNPGHPHDNENIDIYYDGKNLPFPDNAFDTVFCSEVFEHVFSLENLMREINRVLVPGGKLVITCPFLFPEHEQPHDFARYTSFGIKYLFESTGYHILQYEKSGNNTEAIGQLIAVNAHQSIVEKFKKIPVLRQMIRWSVYGSINITTLLLSKIMPKDSSFYMNNIVVGTKK